MVFSKMCCSVLFVLLLVCCASAYDLSSVIDEGLNKEEIEDFSESEDLSDPLREIIYDLDSRDDVFLVEEGIERVLFEGDELSEEELEELNDFLIPILADPEGKTKSINDIDKIAIRENRKIVVGTKVYDRDFLERFLYFVRNFRSNLKSEWLVFTGNAVFEGYLPDYPLEPVLIENFDLLDDRRTVFSSITGDAIIGVPGWSYDGSNEENFFWGAEVDEENGFLKFDLEIETDLNRVEVTEGIVYNTGYYLNEIDNQWVGFDFKGVKVGGTDWLRDKGIANLKLKDFTNEDYAIFLAYSCVKLEEDWDCNNGKWKIFVVETGNVDYHGEIGDLPKMEYREIKNLDVSNITSILNQFGVDWISFQPRLTDVSLFSSFESITVQEGSAQKFEFYLENLGNEDLNDLVFELDLGENEIAEVTGALIPNSVGVGEIVKGTIDVNFKKKGEWSFPLTVLSAGEEVDSSDNTILFKAMVGESITQKFSTDPLDDSWNRLISPTVKESFSNVPYEEGMDLYILSGTDKIRTIFGGYRGGKSINPTMEVHVEPRIIEEALLSKPFISSIFVGGEMITGDREVAEYYVVFTNQKSGEKYATPLMESQFKYYYNPREVIPNFEFCVDYKTEVFLTSKNKEVIDIIEPEDFNVCDFSKHISTFHLSNFKKYERIGGREELVHYFRVVGGLNPKYFEETNVQYKVIFDDSKNEGITYETSIFNSKDPIPIVRVKDVITREIDYSNGELFEGRVVLIDNIDSRGKAGKTFGSNDESLNFVWNEWNISNSLNVKLSLKSLVLEKIITSQSSYAAAYSTMAYTYGGVDNPWTTFARIQNSYRTIPSSSSPEVRRAFFDAIINSSFVFSITDLNDDRKVYEFNSSELCGDYSFSNRDVNQRACYDSSGISSTYLNQLKSFPSFTNGHFYKIKLERYGEKANVFANPTGSNVFFYLDGFQFIVNNPLLRTRFLNLANHPSKFNVKINKEGIPEIAISYIQKNLYFNDSSMMLEKKDITQREILLSDLSTISMNDKTLGPWSYLDFEPLNNKPTFSRLDIRIVPLTKDSNIDSTKSFNCKIGRYDAICYRGVSGYSINYVDEINKFLYQINLYEEDSLFIKKYRDNPEKYDAVVYDILSEIDRNPIVDFEVPFHVENTLRKDKLIFNFITTPVYFPSLKYIYEDIRSGDPEACVYDDNYEKLYGDYPIKLYQFPIKVIADLKGKFHVSVLDAEDYSVIDKKTFDSLKGSCNAPYDDLCAEDEKHYLEMDSWIKSLGLTNNKEYRILLAPFDDKPFDLINNYQSLNILNQYVNRTPYFYARPFIYKKDYDNEVVIENRDFMRKILVLRSTPLGPFDCNTKLSLPRFYNLGFLDLDLDYLNKGFNLIFPDVSYDGFWQRYGAPLFVKKRFKAVFSVDPPLVKKVYDGEYVSMEEFVENTRGDRKSLLSSERAYGFVVEEPSDVYEYYLNSPSYEGNTYDTETKDIVCSSSRVGNFNGRASLILKCRWGNIDRLQIYELWIGQDFNNKSVGDLYNLDDGILNDFRDNYAEVILNEYLERHPSSAILNTTFSSF